MMLLYDGACRVCVAGSRRLVRLASPGAIEAVDFREPGAIDRFPMLTADACERAMQLVLPDGRIMSGERALSGALATRPALRPLAWAMGLPGLRWVARVLYNWLARNRFRIGGRTPGSPCAGGRCEV